MAIATLNPSTGEVEKTFSAHSAEEIDALLDRAVAANGILAETDFAQRATWMRRSAELLETDADQVAALMATEMGKTVTAAKAEAVKCVNAMRFYADNAARFLADETLADPDVVQASAARVSYQPLGTVLAVMPWNFPFWQVIRFAAPGLMAGNTGVLKHASNVPQCALYLGELFARGGFPEGAFQSVLVGGSEVAGLVDDPRIAAVTLTGSVGAGRAIAAQAGQNIKKSVLELGGSDAFVVMPSANLAKAVEVAVRARTQNSGQSCIAAKRFIVHADVYDDFVAAFTEQMGALVVGDPFDDDTDLGPLATEQGRQDVHDLVLDARGLGATVLTGGDLPAGPGFFYPPTVLVDLTSEMKITTEECFGPVASVFKVDTLDQAIDVANGTEFGLSSNAWSTDPAEIDELVTRLEAGAVFVNGMTVSFPELPFGGIKSSGYGRELSAAGIREFCNVKTIWQA
ncbi:NADP-dependent succinic semialdehyde dehydrogenase [Microlunatus panaciterrae]|uniref:Succinate-semialdehyde dehydrogenase/glutarate-semialdehyde dehydrogenase n=1 Tax=Microlunatus panaciterrae TaxID=400768 RepID=A0ABS2RGQ0_9ACTN|nr:aldehyde dehydrogenase family protein [Microlunatus panaciterrae]MBM7797918.1 succinate-semialdehyde dehydrogenase/glutarate-semialdehyde dehydrogenase [Microlunatus panaciterrae]